MKAPNRLASIVLTIMVCMASLATFSQQFVNNGFESWEENDGMMDPVGWGTTNVFVAYITVAPSTEACNSDLSAKISSTGPGLEGPQSGGIGQIVMFDNMVSIVNIQYNYAIDTLSEGAFASVKLTAWQITPGDGIGAGQQEIIYDEMNPECTLGSMYFESEIPFNKIRLEIRAYPAYDMFGTHGLSIIRFDDIVISTNVSASSISNPALEIILQPNPVSSQLTITTDAIINELNLTDINGKLVKKLNPVERTIDMSKMLSGLYFLRITTPEGVYTKKVVKE
ncbi:T9SS type A sorting domain-containing protein [Cryomorpha ignava]|uniref:T9SS type A sorting domain-containing protein n=1 Tax=Cryomorpha ignava TaxID=101383 RepID=A0A7K3WRZ1_9FLAO|nr:T9SS type A sorting domain-containing protein [Cryomorpha ignava]NEN24440.1 T9SS type A sorting domain-containing protein [Cryomorpha ignava]